MMLIRMVAKWRAYHWMGQRILPEDYVIFSSMMRRCLFCVRESSTIICVLDELAEDRRLKS